MTQSAIFGFNHRKAFCGVLIILLCGSALAAPPEPPNLCVSTKGNTVSLNWYPVESAAGYELYYAPYPDATPISSLDLGNTTIISEELPLGSAYFVALKSYNASGASNYSNVGQFILSATELPQIAFAFGDSMDSSESSKIQSDALQALEFFESQSFPRFQPTVTVHAYDDYEELLDAYIETFTPCVASSLGLIIRSSGLTLAEAEDGWGNGSTQGNAIGNDFFINSANFHWRTIFTEAFKAKVVAHELFHTLQYQLVEGPMFAGPNTEVPLAGPRWLLEGSGDVVGYMMLDWAGLSDFDSDLQSAIDSAARTEYLLENMENSPGMYSTEAPFQIAFIAAAFLSRDLSKFVSFFSLISDEVTWEEAFIQAFGKSVDAFYAEYKAYVNNGYQ